MTTISAPTAKRLRERPAREAQHPQWCVRRYCQGRGSHNSLQFTLDGEVPLVVEVFQQPEDASPRLSILERWEGGAVVTVSVDQGVALAAVLEHVASGVETGRPLDPPGAGRAF